MSVAYLNLAANAKFSPAGGYPLSLSPLGQQVAEGVIPPRTASVTAEIAATAGSCTAHLALFALPAASGDPDGEEVERTDAEGVTTTAQDITVSIPDTDADPVGYVVRLWYSDATGINGLAVNSMGID